MDIRWCPIWAACIWIGNVLNSLHVRHAVQHDVLLTSKAAIRYLTERLGERQRFFSQIQFQDVIVRILSTSSINGVFEYVRAVAGPEDGVETETDESAGE